MHNKCQIDFYVDHEENTYGNSSKNGSVGDGKCRGVVEHEDNVEENSDQENVRCAGDDDGIEEMWFRANSNKV